MELTREDFQSGLESVKNYFDEKTSEMKSYVDEENTELEHNLKSYVDEKNTELKNYVDEKNSQLEENLKSYVDEKISGVIFYVDEKHHEIKNYVDEKFADTQTQFLKLDTNDKIISSQIEDAKFASSLSVGTIATIAAIIMLAPLLRETIAGLRDFFTRPKDDLNAQIENIVQKVLNEKKIS